ncbi:MAG: histidine kinase [Chitinophagaceae bacterium]|nr:histidine kinase [Chitinophagaceae bacterium]
MKLLTKTTLYFLSAMLTLLGITGFYLFKQFSKGLDERSDKELLAGELEWVRYLESQAGQGTAFILRSKEISIFPTDAPPEDYPVISNAGDYTYESGVRIPYRQLSQVVSIEGLSYQLTIKKSQEQKTALIKSFTRIMMIVFAGLFLATILFNWVISRKLWRPFRQSLQKIRTADLQKMQTIHFEKTNTREFNELNASLNFMTGKIYDDFLSMKEFTEDAAHEMQTPIAVVQSKLEILLQDNNLTAEQVEAVMQAADALTRLSRLNQGLLFLARIQNNQYTADSLVDFEEITRKYLALFSELIKEKQIEIKTDITGKFKIQLHYLLADSMVSNLLGNAIRYNYPGGQLNVTITDTQFCISNTSQLDAIPKDKLFKRFSSTKNRDISSSGLGLAIVKKIAETNDLEISYRMENGIHLFTVSKNK